MTDPAADPPRRRRRRHRHRRPPEWRQHWGWTLAVGLAALALALALVLLSRRNVQAQGVFQPAPGGVAADPGNPATLAAVVYNTADPLSEDLARFYAERRGIPEERLIALRCSTEEEISREEYERDVAAPLRRAFDERRWWSRSPDRPPAGPDDRAPASQVFSSRVRYLVLVRGVPLKIRPEPPAPGDTAPANQPPVVAATNAAAVDSELATLGLFPRDLAGMLPNPYFRAYARIADFGVPGLLLVGRLDAPTAAGVRRMVEDSLYAERNGLWGRAYVDSRGLPPSDALAVGDTWFDHAAPDLAARALPTVHDRRPELFGPAYPMTEAALYLGWYAGDVTGPFARGDFRFVRGAVAYHLHSFSAVTLRDPTHHWTGPLVAAGAAASLGCVYEPYLGLTPRVDVLAARLRDGFTFAEAAYMASPGLSWMTTVVGDPLYRPGKLWGQIADDGARDADLPPPDGPVAAEGRAYLRGATVWRQRGAKEGAVELERAGRALRSGRVFEGLGLLQAAAGDRDRARAAWEQAGRFYAHGPDQARIALHLARLRADAGDKAGAAEGLRRAAARYTLDSPAAAALREMELELFPPPPPAPPPPPPAAPAKPR